MPVRIQNITRDPIQRHTITTEGRDVILRLWFHPLGQFWTMDVTYGDKQVNGVRLFCGGLHITSANMPVDFEVVDVQRAGLDPFRRDDFEAGRCALVMLLPDDMEAVRGQPVPL